MNQSVLIDSAAILALLDKKDADHGVAKDTLNKLASDGSPVFTTNFIRAEAYTLIGIRLSWAIARAWLRDLDVPIEPVTNRDEERAVKILTQYEDKSVSFVDATSFAVMERLSVDRAFTCDRHFQQFGFMVMGNFW